MHNVLVLLPDTNDRAQAAKLNENQFEVHFLHASENDADEILSTFAYNTYLAKPGFLTTYVERAIKYVEKNGITAIMFSHDMSSVVASVVCEKTGLRENRSAGSVAGVHLSLSAQVLLESDRRRRALVRLHMSG